MVRIYKRRSEQYLTMKKFLFIFSLSFILLSCTDSTFVEKQIVTIVDSVEYHGIGHDNTLQTTPYWKLWLRNEKITIRSYRNYNVGDTIEIIERKIKK